MYNDRGIKRAQQSAPFSSSTIYTYSVLTSMPIYAYLKIDAFLCIHLDFIESFSFSGVPFRSVVGDVPVSSELSVMTLSISRLSKMFVWDRVCVCIHRLSVYACL